MNYLLLWDKTMRPPLSYAQEKPYIISCSGIASPLLPPVASFLIKADMERSGGMNSEGMFVRISNRLSCQLSR